MAILLQEEGIYDKCKLYGTDFSPTVLEEARKGVYRIDNIKNYTANYLKAGGKESFSDYYTAAYQSGSFLYKGDARNARVTLNYDF